MRILHVVARSQRRGAETAALELADALDRLGHDDRLVALRPAFDGGRDDALPVLDDEVGPRALGRIRRWRALRAELARNAPDVVLAHGGEAAEVAVLAAGRRGPPVVWQRILGFPAGVWSSPRRFWWRVVARRTAAAVALTRADVAELRRLGFAGPVWRIPNFRDPERFVTIDRRDAARRLRAELGVDDDVPLVGLVGHLVVQKRPERALDVIDRVRARGIAVHLVVAGSGPLRSALEQDAVERAIEHAVTFLGHRDDVGQVLAALDLLLLTSDVEGIPGIVIESQMAGCPVVTFPLGGVAEVVDHGRTGVVLSQPDTTVMAEHVVDLLADPVRRSALGAEGRRRADAFSTGRAAATYDQRLAALVPAGAGAEIAGRYDGAMPSASSQPTATVGRVVDQIPRDGGHPLQPSWVNPDSHRGRFEQLAELFRGRSVLDVGCASGWKRPDWFHRLLAGVADELVGVDVDPVAVAAIADAGFDVRLADAETLDLGRRFDVVHAGEIIEHLDNPGGFLDAARRHLGPGGRLVVTTPNPFCVTNFVYRLGGRPRVNADHTCWYCEDTLSQLLVRHGFAVSEVRYLRHPTPGALRARLSGAVRALLPDRLAWNSLLVVARPVPGA